MVKTQSSLDGYTKDELLHIVEIYNLGLDMKTLKKKKEDLIKAMKDVGKKKLVDLPREEIKKQVKKKKKSKLLKGQKTLEQVGIKKKK